MLTEAGNTLSIYWNLKASELAAFSPGSFLKRFGKYCLFALILLDGARIADAAAAPDGHWGRTSSTTVKITLRIPERFDSENLTSARLLKEKEEVPIDTRQLIHDACHTTLSSSNLSKSEKPASKISLGNFQLKSYGSDLSQSLSALCKNRSQPKAKQLSKDSIFIAQPASHSKYHNTSRTVAMPSSSPSKPAHRGPGRLLFAPI